jgi:hypothetical protein
MRFAASYDRATKIISGCVCLGMLAVVYAVHNFAMDLLAFLVLMLCVTYSPRGYVIEGHSILVKRLAGAARIALDGVREVRRATPDDLRGCIRLWGSGGLFGYYGLFSTSKLGKSTWYVTNRSNCVVLITAAKTFLFSPDDPDGFLATIDAVAAPVAASNPRMEVPAARRSLSLRTVIGGCVAAIALGVAAIAMAYSPGPPSYTLTSDSLTIHDRFYPLTLAASDIDVSAIRVVDFEQDRTWRPVLRTNGFANSHYQSGWFEVSNGTKVRLYRAGGSRVVLLPPKGASAAVLLQASDPDALVAELRAAWSGAHRAEAKSEKMESLCAAQSS